MGLTSDDIYNLKAGLNLCRDRLEQMLERIEEMEQIIDNKEVEGMTINTNEYLVISAALKQFAENPNNDIYDVEVSKQMRKVMGNYGKNQYGHVDE